MTGWWRRNAVALGAIAVLTPVTFGAIAWEGWQGYFLYQNSIPVDVAEDDSIDLADTTWGPIRASEITDTTGFTVPSDARVIAAAIPVDPHGELPGCFAPTLVQQSTGIRWPESRFQLGLLSSSEEPTSCVTGDDVPTGPYELIVPFIVPDDAEGPFWVEVAPTPAVPSVIRFAIDP